MRCRKSQLAIEHAYRVRNRAPETFVLWLHASSGRRFAASVHDTLQQLKVPGRTDPEASIYRLLRDWLQERKDQPKWLVVLDSADNPRFLVEPPAGAGSEERCIDYFPVCEHGALLLTTRSRETVLRVLRPHDIVDVPPLDPEHSCALLEKKLSDESLCNHKELCELSEKLDHMPLALVQAASYISQRAPRCSVLRYIEKLSHSDDKQFSLLSRDEGDCRRDRDAKNSVMLTWEISFDHIRQEYPSAADLLSLMSFFDRQAIPEDLLQSRRPSPTDAIALEPLVHLHNHENNLDSNSIVSEIDSEDFEDDLRILRSYSLVAVTADSTVFEMHRLVQLASQRWLTHNKQLETWGECFVRILDNAVSKVDFHDSTNIAIGRKIYAHAIMAMKPKLVVQEAVGRRASLSEQIAIYATKIGAITDAELFITQALADQRELLGDHHGKTLQLMHDLGTLYTMRSRFDAAENLFREGIERTRNSSKILHVYFRSELALTYLRTSRPEEAERLLVTCLEAFEDLLGRNDILLLNVLTRIAAIYRLLNRHAEAALLLEKGLEKVQKIGPQAEGLQLNITSSLADTYAQLERFEEAEILQARALEASTIESRDFVPVMSGMLNLAGIQFDRGRPGPALQLVAKCIRGSARHLGAEHPCTLELARTMHAWLVKVSSANGGGDAVDEMQVGQSGCMQRVGDE